MRLQVPTRCLMVIAIDLNMVNSSYLHRLPQCPCWYYQRTLFIYFRFDQLLFSFSVVENSPFVAFTDEAPGRSESRACYFIQRTKKRLMLLKHFCFIPNLFLSLALVTPYISMFEMMIIVKSSTEDNGGADEGRARRREVGRILILKPLAKCACWSMWENFHAQVPPYRYRPALFISRPIFFFTSNMIFG